MHSRTAATEEESDWHRDPEKAKKYKSRLEDWILAVNLLLSWDDQKTISAADMEEFLSKFLEYDAKVKYRITPRLTSEIFLRGILRTLWDIDRLLRFMNPGDELKMVTAKSPMVLSILRVMAYEFMWTPSCTPRGAKEGARDLMERVNVSVKADRDWITDAMVRMGEAFEKAHNAWDKKHAAAKEKKRRERAEAAAAAAGNSGDLAAGGAKLKLAENAKAAKAGAAQVKRKRGAEGAKRKGADAQFGNARALAVKEQALAGKADQAADSQKRTRAAVVRPAAAQDDGEEEEEGEEGAAREATADAYGVELEEDGSPGDPSNPRSELPEPEAESYAEGMGGMGGIEGAGEAKLEKLQASGDETNALGDQDGEDAEDPEDGEDGEDGPGKSEGVASEVAAREVAAAEDMSMWAEEC
ncbi:unnamed protein product [Symbiodinium natans]|uniref:Uncharacterized protein n=1 Tax=Symbiodinium natans TaxID=878477 RepID=A0A812MXG1_9DINO|nr:unnamed protein product [Symbiodinium natans]